MNVLLNFKLTTPYSHTTNFSLSIKRHKIMVENYQILHKEFRLFDEIYGSS